MYTAIYLIAGYEIILQIASCAVKFIKAEIIHCTIEWVLWLAIQAATTPIHPAHMQHTLQENRTITGMKSGEKDILVMAVELLDQVSPT